MTIVVTGASGFIGTHLVHGLLARGEVVIGLDRRPPTVVHEGYIHLTADLASPGDDALEVLRAAYGVVHLAARAGVREHGPEVEHRRHLDNVVAAEQVLASVPHDVPLLVTSSSSVYGGARRGRPSRETDRPRPHGGYARTKVAVEARCAARAAAGGCVTVARPFTVVGEGQRPDMALSRWIADARAGRPLTVFGGLDRCRDVTDVRCVVRALITLLDRSPVTTVNIGTGTAHTLGELTTAVRRVVAEVPVEVRPRPVAEPDATLADVHRGRAVFGFVPSTDVIDVVRRAATAIAAPLVSSGDSRSAVRQ
jgi:nucleoside-diphosphate-sugar epimerase